MLFLFYRNFLNQIDSLRLKFSYFTKIRTHNKIIETSKVFRKKIGISFIEVCTSRCYSSIQEKICKYLYRAASRVRRRALFEKVNSVTVITDFSLTNRHTLFLGVYNSISDLWWRSFSFGFYYLQGFTFLLFIDACLTDDEPLCEPIEWSLVQT